jgi:competence protein ComFB
MEILNLQEESVRLALEDQLAQKPDICHCPQCFADMMIFALNRLPPRYVSHTRGRTFSRLAQEDTQGRTSLLTAVLAAIKTVSASPNHALQDSESTGEGHT